MHAAGEERIRLGAARAVPRARHPASP